MAGIDMARPKSGQHALAPPSRREPSKLLLATCHLLMTFAALSYGGYNILLKKLTEFPDSMSEKEQFCRQTTFIFYRISSATVLLVFFGVFCQSQPKLPESRWHTMSYIVQGGTGIFIAQYFFLLGLGHTSPTDAAVVQATTPLIVVFIAVMCCFEKLTLRKAVGFAVGVGGAIVTLGPSIWHGTSSDFVGYMLLVIQTTSESVFLLFLKKSSQRVGYTAAINTMYQYLFGSIFMGGTAASACYNHPEAFETPGVGNDFTWIALAYAIVIASCTNCTIITYCCTYLEASTVGFYGLVQPFATAVFAYFAFGTKLKGTDFIGMIMVVVGIVIVNWPVKSGGTTREHDDEEETTQLLSASMSSTNNSIT
eukprot:m.89637 g.89637  ORF g.89637 m.89637 type:complete len:367 (+) comp26318_c0_seq2:424-1524(+)